MKLHHALSVAAAVWTAAPACAADDPRPHPARHAAARRPAAAHRPAAQPAAPGEAATTPLFPDAAAGTDADRAAALERRRKAFFAPPPDGPAAPDAPPVGVTLGGDGGLTPSMGLKF